MLEARNISVSYGPNSILSNVSLQLKEQHIYCISGNSGCGKTTLGRVLAGLHKPNSGAVFLEGNILSYNSVWPVQYLYQSPLTAMNPNWRVSKILCEAGEVDGELASILNVSPEWADRFPHELSGGQLQRVAILRSLGMKPRYLVADEITSGLDPLAQAQVWHLLLNLTNRLGIGIIAISHDEALLKQIGTDSSRLHLS